MSSRIFTNPKNKTPTTFSPKIDKKLSGRTFTPAPTNENHNVESSGFGHNFGDVQVESPSSKQSCPLALSGPAHCPFGGACHTCPPIVQTKLKIGEPGDKYEQEADQVAEKVMGMPGPEGVSDLEGHIDGVQVGGQPLPEPVRTFFESRFQHDFNRVRVFTDARAAGLAHAIHASAFTLGRDVMFDVEQYAPNTPSGRLLLAHELTHVVQQGEAKEQQNAENSPVVSERGYDRIQGSFFGDLWEGVKSVGRAVGKAVSGAVEWVGGRLRDAAMWGINLVRDLPSRLVRLGQTILDGLAGIVSFIPEAIQALASGGISGFASWLWEKAKAGGFWLLRLLSRIFDILGGPELVEFITHIVTHATPLTTAEKAAAQSVLGSNAIRWHDVRVAESGLLSIIFHFNQGRAFATFHTINLPSTGAHGRSNLAIVVHELTHVYQYERVGSLYLGQAIHAQATIGYGYGGSAGLSSDRAAGKHYRDYNREQQAQIAQDYYTLLASGGATTDYDPFIDELRAGNL